MQMISPDSHHISICERFQAYLPLFLVFMSGFGFSIQGLIIKILEERGFSGSFELIVVRGMIQSSVSAGIIYYNKLCGETAKLFGDSNYAKIILALRALFGFTGIAFGFLAIEHLPIGDASTLLMQSPVLSAILGYIILGVILIARPPFIFKFFDGSTDGSENQGDNLGVLFGIIAALSAGSSFIMVRLLGTSAKMPWANVGFAASMAQFLLALPMVFLSGQTVDIRLGYVEWTLLILGGTIGTISQLAMTIGMQREKSAKASAMRTSDVFFAFVWEVLFTDDKVTAMSAVGACLVMIGVLIIIAFKSSEEDLSMGKDSTESQSNEGVEIVHASSSSGIVHDRLPTTVPTGSQIIEQLWSFLARGTLKGPSLKPSGMKHRTDEVSLRGAGSGSVRSGVQYSRLARDDDEEKGALLELTTLS